MKKLLVIMLALTLFISLFAVPARPGFRPFKQPDGSTVILELKGDEHFHFAETRDGHSVIKDAEGWWTYAQKVDGLLVPTMFIAGRDECPFPGHLRPEADAVAALPVNKYRQINWNKFPQPDIYTKDGRADKRILIALGAFSDSTYFGTDIPANYDDTWGVAPGFTSAAIPGGTAHDSVYWDSVFFSDNKASFKKYYAELSFGTWIAEGHVLGPLVPLKRQGNNYIPQPYSAYGDGAELTYMEHIAYSLDQRMDLYGSNGSDFDSDGAVTYDDFDGDGDGYVDHYVVVRCGGECSSTGDPADMWATKYNATIGTDNATILNPVNAGELTEQDITRDPSLDTMYVRSRTMGIGVHAHESFHAFGAPDLYDYGYESTTAGDWSLMDGGSWTSDGVQPASRPAHPGAMLQYDIPGAPESQTDGFFSTGWAQSISTNGRYPVVGLGHGPTYGGPRLYLVQNGNFQTKNEYFLIENRCDVGEFEGNLPEHGLVISHYDPSEKGSRYNEGPGDATYYTYWIEQDGFDPQVHVDNPIDTIYRNVMTAAYRAGDSDHFDNTTSAGSNSNDLSVDGPHIIDISAPGDTMWFTLDNCATPGSPVFAKLDITILDNIAGYGDNDGLADPDEMFDLVVNIKNVGSNANNVTGVLTSKDGKATISDANGTWGNIATDASAENTADALRIKLEPGYGPGEYVRCNLAVTSNEGATTDIEIALLINDPKVVDHFDLKDIRGGMADPSGIDINYHPTLGWIMFASGTGLGTVTGDVGQNRIYAWTHAQGGWSG
ncbi:MAG: immune inhibitor A, partial [candidate division WOR-3 bacterium]|nr:immune inhibitor A [candidate division WOR-3 bacterium]